MPNECLDPLLVEVGARLRSARVRQGLTQGRLGEMVGLHRTYVGELERGKRNVGLRTLADLAAALEVELPDLLPETSD